MLRPRMSLAIISTLHHHNQGHTTSTRRISTTMKAVQQADPMRWPHTCVTQYCLWCSGVDAWAAPLMHTLAEELVPTRQLHHIAWGHKRRRKMTCQHYSVWAISCTGPLHSIMSVPQWRGPQRRWGSPAPRTASPTESITHTKHRERERQRR